MTIRYRVAHDGRAAGDVEEVSAAVGCRLQGETVAEILDRGVSKKLGCRMVETTQSKIVKAQLEERRGTS